MKTVILAEDDTLMVSLLRTLLSMEGFQVLATETKPQQILQAVYENRPDVILLDVHLTGGSGLDVVRELRARSSNGPRVIMISGMDMREQCLKAGADAFLLKPFMPDDLIKTIRQLTS